MSDGIGWRFPPTDGGLGHGFNDPGIAHFAGAPIQSLARETIQNSLDARLDQGKPVHVSFELIHLPPEEIGPEELALAINACTSRAGDDQRVTAALEEALNCVKSESIRCLRVSDRNTTGLRDEHWRALVKMQGLSFKPDAEGAGGSHGIGKYAPFAVSIPRTIFYWTCFHENGEDRERFQGKSVLMSHEDKEGKETQGTGFYGFKDDCRELMKEIPQSFRVIDQDQRPVQGTSVAITGFRETEDWRRRIAASAIGNFFYAIGTRRLTVIVEPDDSDSVMDMEIDHESLEDWFQHLAEIGEGDDPANTLQEAQTFWQLSQDEPAAEKQDQDFGHCRLWIRTAEGLPNKVGFVRGTGMLVTTQQKGLIRFSGFRDFAALCLLEDPAGNELLRRMENPAHDKFEPERLPQAERGRGRSALKRITEWIRSEIRKQAGPPEGGQETLLSELAAYLPDYQPEEPFDSYGDDEGSGEPGFGERVTLKLRPARRLASRHLPPDGPVGEDSEGEGEDTGALGGAGTVTNGGGGGSGGSGEGLGQGGTGIRGGGAKLRGIPVSRVRILRIEGKDNCFRLSFLADGDGVVRLSLDEAGDYSAVSRNDVRGASENTSLDRVLVKKGRRTELDITADEPIGGRAWRLTAAEVREDSQ